MNKFIKMGVIALVQIAVLSTVAIRTEAKTNPPDKKTNSAYYYIVKSARNRKYGEAEAKLQNIKRKIVIPKAVRIKGKVYAVTKVSGMNYPCYIDSTSQADPYKCIKNKKTVEVNLPSTVQIVEKGTFTNFTKLEKIKVDKKSRHFKSLNGSLFSRDGKKLYGVPTVKGTYKLPEGVLVITSRTFAYSPVETMILSESCQQIEEMAFYKSGLREIYNTDGVKKLGKNAFYGTSVKKRDIKR